MVGFEEMRDELLERIEDLLKRKQYTALRDLLADLEPADIASLFEDLDEDSIPLLFRLLPKEPAAEVFVELDPDAQEMLIRGFSNTELKEVLDELYLDDAVDIVEEMPANVVKRILKHADPDTRKSINEILKYPDDSAGALMTTEFVDLKRDMTVEDALSASSKRAMIWPVNVAETIRSSSQGIRDLYVSQTLVLRYGLSVGSIAAIFSISSVVSSSMTSMASSTVMMPTRRSSLSTTGRAMKLYFEKVCATSSLSSSVETEMTCVSMISSMVSSSSERRIVRSETMPCSLRAGSTT